ncbi:hypothetical protein D3C81_1087820 [compost metagenome]
MLHTLNIAVLFDWRAVIAIEGLAVAEPTGHEEMKLRPKLAQVVFQRRAAQAQALAGLQVTGRLRRFADRVFDVLRFVENQYAPQLRLQGLQIPWQQRVSGQHQIVLSQISEILLPPRAVQRQYFQLGGEALGLVEPVGNQAGRHHRQSRTIKATGVFFREQMRQGLQRFAQPHVIAQNAAYLKLAQGLHPVEAFELIRAQLRVKAGRRSDVGVTGILQTLGEGAQPLAPLPIQRHAIEHTQARGIRDTQAQCITLMTAQVQLAQRGHQRFDPTQRQRDLGA